MKKGTAKVGDQVVPIANRKGQKYTVAETDGAWGIRLEYKIDDGSMAGAGWADCGLYTKVIK